MCVYASYVVLRSFVFVRLREGSSQESGDLPAAPPRTQWPQLPTEGPRNSQTQTDRQPSG